MSRPFATACAILPLLSGAGAQAQTADLRYAAPLPAAVKFTTTDTISNTISGLPMGDMTTTGTLQSISHVRFVQADTGLSVAVKLLQLEGSMSTPMGPVPLSAGESETLELELGDRGPDEAAVARTLGAQPAGGSPEARFGPHRALAVLVNVPGRVLRVGETWTDTMAVEPELAEMEIDGLIVLHGTYTGDTIVGGRTLNVLRIETNMTTTTTTESAEGGMKQNLASEGRAVVLWDSGRHIPLHSDVTADVTARTEMAAQGLSFDMKLTTRSITVAEPES